MTTSDAAYRRSRSPRRRTSQTSAPMDGRTSMDTSSPPSSPERTAEYWDKRVQELRERRERMRREAKASSPGRATSPNHANVLDIISSYERDNRPMPPAPASSPTSASQPSSFEFGFSLERDRADSAHDFTDMPPHLRTAKSPTHQGQASPPPTANTCTSASGRRKEGQTLADPSPNKRKPSKSERTRRWSRNYCPVRPPRPEISLLPDDILPQQPLPPAKLPPIVIPRKPVALSHQRSMPIRPSTALSGRLSPGGRISTTEPNISKVTSAPETPSATREDMVDAFASGALSGDESYALQHTVSVWEDDDEKVGLVNYIKWTLHSRKLSADAREKEKERSKSSAALRKASVGAASGERTRSGSMRRMLRAFQFRCGHDRCMREEA